MVLECIPEYNTGNHDPSYDDDCEYMKLGNIGQYMAYKLLRQLFPGATIRDVSQSPEYQKKSIDLIVTHPNGREETYECKNDTHIAKTRNMAFEYLRHNHNSTRNPFRFGWACRSEASFLTVYVPPNEHIKRVRHSIIKIPMDTFRVQLNKYLWDLRESATNPIVPMEMVNAIIPIKTDNQRTTMCYLLPFEYWKPPVSEIHILPQTWLNSNGA